MCIYHLTCNISKNSNTTTFHLNHSKLQDDDYGIFENVWLEFERLISSSRQVVHLQPDVRVAHFPPDFQVEFPNIGLDIPNKYKRQRLLVVNSDVLETL